METNTRLSWGIRNDGDGIVIEKEGKTLAFQKEELEGLRERLEYILFSNQLEERLEQYSRTPDGYDEEAKEDVLNYALTLWLDNIDRAWKAVIEEYDFCLKEI